MLLLIPLSIRLTTKCFCTRYNSSTVMTCAKFHCDWLSKFKPEHCKFWSNFKFDWNNVSGTGAWWHVPFADLYLAQAQMILNLWWHQTSNISCTLVGNKIVDYSDVVGALPVGTAPTTSSFWTKHRAPMNWAKTPVGAAPTISSFWTKHLASMNWAKTKSAWWDEKHLGFGIWWGLF